MGLREKINQNPAVAAGVTGAILLIAVVMIIRSFSGSTTTQGQTTKDYYTVDDGATWFPDEAYPARIPPYDYQGKKAYRVLLWTCDGGKTKIVSAVQKFSDVAKKKLDPLVAAKKFDDPIIGQVGETWEGAEVKPPKTGDTGWIPFNDPKAANLTSPACPDGRPSVRLAPE